MPTYRQKTYEIVGWTYEAATHCPRCAEKHFGADIAERYPPPLDSEGNEAHPVLAEDASGWGYSCDDCFEPLDD